MNIGILETFVLWYRQNVTIIMLMHLHLHNSCCVYKDEPHLSVYRAAHQPNLTVSMIYAWTPAVEDQ